MPDPGDLFLSGFKMSSTENENLLSELEHWWFSFVLGGRTSIPGDRGESGLRGLQRELRDPSLLLSVGAGETQALSLSSLLVSRRRL